MTRTISSTLPQLTANPSIPRVTYYLFIQAIKIPIIHYLRRALIAFKARTAFTHPLNTQPILITITRTAKQMALIPSVLGITYTNPIQALTII
jgi:hypothetical protein